ncbi:hypothetical protein D6D21_02011, partial [Aureobasidium pullulans]
GKPAHHSVSHALQPPCLLARAEASRASSNLIASTSPANESPYRPLAPVRSYLRKALFKLSISSAINILDLGELSPESMLQPRNIANLDRRVRVTTAESESHGKMRCSSPHEHHHRFHEAPPNRPLSAPLPSPHPPKYAAPSSAGA